MLEECKPMGEFIKALLLQSGNGPGVVRPRPLGRFETFDLPPLPITENVPQNDAGVRDYQVDPPLHHSETRHVTNHAVDRVAFSPVETHTQPARQFIESQVPLRNGVDVRSDQRIQNRDREALQAESDQPGSHKAVPEKVEKSEIRPARRTFIDPMRHRVDAPHTEPKPDPLPSVSPGSNGTRKVKENEHEQIPVNTRTLMPVHAVYQRIMRSFMAGSSTVAPAETHDTISLPDERPIPSGAAPTPVYRNSIAHLIGSSPRRQSTMLPFKNASQKEAQKSSDAPTSISIEIGAVEIKTTVPPTSRQREKAPQSDTFPVMGLDEFLNRRMAGGAR
jgi:hypothetical protein